MRRIQLLGEHQRPRHKAAVGATITYFRWAPDFGSTMLRRRTLQRHVGAFLTIARILIEH